MPKAVKKNSSPVKHAPATVKKVPVQAVHQPVQVKSVSQVIWQTIENLPMEIFGLPGQTVGQYYQPFVTELDPNKCLLVAKTNATAALPALENALASHYNVAKEDSFVVVTVKPVKVK
jgi:hypothetical protein